MKGRSSGSVYTTGDRARFSSTASVDEARRARLASPARALPARSGDRGGLRRPPPEGVLTHVVRRQVVDRHREGAIPIAGVVLLDLLAGRRLGGLHRGALE